jgi:CCR4-NOT transcriptional regulation complex NOT5 subunit
MECPFLCGFHTSNDNQAEYHITAHIELHHTPESQFTAEDEDLKFALALQREEEERVLADVENHDTATHCTAEEFDPRTEGAVNNAMDDDFPYVECPECEDFVHLIELDEHMNNHLSLQNSSDTTTGNMARSGFGPGTNSNQSLTASGCSTTIARPMKHATERFSGIVRTATSFSPPLLCLRESMTRFQCLWGFAES